MIIIIMYLAWWYNCSYVTLEHSKCWGNAWLVSDSQKTRYVDLRLMKMLNLSICQLDHWTVTLLLFVKHPTCAFAFVCSCNGFSYINIYVTNTLKIKIHTDQDHSRSIQIKIIQDPYRFLSTQNKYSLENQVWIT